MSFISGEEYSWVVSDRMMETQGCIAEFLGQ